jgi:hypothetical protein
MSEIEIPTAVEDSADAPAAVVALRRLADLLEDAAVERAMRAGWGWPLQGILRAPAGTATGPYRHVTVVCSTRQGGGELPWAQHDLCCREEDGDGSGFARYRRRGVGGVEVR